MGVGSSRMSGVNNVALWTGKKASPYIPYVNVAPIVAGTNGISPIFLTTVGVTGGIGIDLKNWVKKKDSDGNVILNNDGRADKPLVEGSNFKEGQYELVFFVGDYFKKITELPTTPFLNEIIIRFGISNPKEHYHVPLLVSPWSYSTYRGS